MRPEESLDVIPLPTSESGVCLSSLFLRLFIHLCKVHQLKRNVQFKINTC